jgi:hypothetical protein
VKSSDSGVWNGGGGAVQRCKCIAGGRAIADEAIRLTDAGSNFVGHHMPPPLQHSRMGLPPISLVSFCGKNIFTEQ